MDATAGDSGMRCTADGDCDDGLHCNGAERCDPADRGAAPDGCVGGVPVDCDDGEVCTTDVCDESTRDCTHLPPDADGDGHDPIGCATGDDCDDTDATRHPGAAEVCDGDDEDCDAATLGDTDADRDTYVSTACCDGARCGDDCDDAMSGVHPTATETCNTIDDDCDARIDEAVMAGCWADTDRDGFAPAGAGMVMACTCADGFTATDPASSADCDDADPMRNPAVPEVCNGVDDDCDGMSNEGFPLNTCYADMDGDGYAPVGATVTTPCLPCPMGTVTIAPVGRSADCDDADATRSPGLRDADCDCVDDDCDGVADDPASRPRYYRDADGDGYGDTTDVRALCACDPATAGRILDDADCCDSDPDARPGQTAWFTVPRMGCGGYDYDCSTVEERQYPTTSRTTCPITAMSGCPPSPAVTAECRDSAPTAYWVGSAPPGCGVAGDRPSGCAASCPSPPDATCRAVVGSRQTMGCH